MISCRRMGVWKGGFGKRWRTSETWTVGEGLWRALASTAVVFKENECVVCVVNANECVAGGGDRAC